MVGETRGAYMNVKKSTRQHNSGAGRQHWGRDATETSQGKDIEGGVHVRLDNRKEGNKNSLYWYQVDWVDALVYNGGSISQW